ncbi:MAG: hypothetical protein FJ271_27630 [Planctomycetes bacterium]|nr:hypothetical protein [Planctomycetota bacterium]
MIRTTHSPWTNHAGSRLQLHEIILVNDDPYLFPAGAGRDGDIAERRFQDGQSVTPGDGDGAASVEPAAAHLHLLAAPGLLIRPEHADDQPAFEPNVVFER